MKQRIKPIRLKDYSRYPFTNLSLNDMEGEEWRDVPEFDGYIKVSSFGRVWSLPRLVHSLDGHYYHTRELIRKQTLAKRYNSYTKDYREQLYVHIRYEGKSRHFCVNRLVYCLFIKPIDFEQDGLMVVHKDGDNCNNRSSNLDAMDGTELYAHDLKIKRRPLTRRMGKKRNSKSDTNSARPVVQYTLNGKKLAEYESIAHAAEMNKIDRGSIRQVATRKLKQYHRLVYRYKGERYYGEYVDFSAKKRVTQYTIDGKRIAVYTSVKEASSLTGVNADTISKCALGKCRLGSGYVWRYPGDSYQGEYKDKIKNKARPLVQYKLDGKRVSYFASVSQASAQTGFHASSLLDCAFKRTRVSHGFVWRFEGDSYKGEHQHYRIGRPVTQYSLEGKKIKTFSTIQAAALATGLTPDNIQKNSKGENKTAGGFSWKYASNQDIKKLPGFQPALLASSSVGKEVIQYSIDGKKAVPFASISEAATISKISPSNISAVLDKPGRSAAGFVWRSKGNRYRGELFKKPAVNKARAISQYNLKGNRINVFNSTFEAEKITGIPASAISSVARGKLKTAGRFIWQYGDNVNRIDVNAHYASTREVLASISKPVIKCSLDGELIAEFPSMASAARVEGVSYKSISSAVNGITKSAAGYLWKLK